MRAIVLAPGLALALLGCAGTPRPHPAQPQSLEARVEAALDSAAARYRRVAPQLDPAAGAPRATRRDGSWQQTRINDWTSGFFPGALWLLHSHTGDPALAHEAARWTRPLERIPEGSYSHDLGFQFNSSFGNAFRFTGDTAWRAPALRAAALLAARFNPAVGAIKSWDFMPPTRPYPVIADNMMNLELLFWAARQPGGDPAWHDLALRHARTTLRHHLRPDGGSFHVVIFDPKDGAVLERITHQGAADSSTWARGQAWLTYGFTMSYRESGREEFLAAARRLADYTIERAPADAVPCWDYDAAGCPDSALRDASAAAITASALLELSTHVDAAAAARYRAHAERILFALAAPPYLAPAGAAALLARSVGNLPAGTEVDVGISYADYYAIEALLRWRELTTGTRRLLDDAAPATHTLRGEWLRGSRERLRRQDAALLPALRRLRAEADSTLGTGPFTVTAKERVPPSGDVHDYQSFGPYWWPDSTRPGGLPYIRRDGVVNQVLRRDSDALRFYPLVDAVETLALAHYFTDDPRYARRAALLLRTWFVDSATRMNPHLRFAQAIPGVSEGRGIGLIDFRDIGRLTDALTLLRRSPDWTPADQHALDAWLADYYQWLRTSENGRDEQDEPNNHGTWYDVQLASLALFLGDSAAARDVVARSAPARLADQLDPDGRLPRETGRTRGLHYSLFNLEAFSRLAELARHLGEDLWHWQDPQGRSLERGLRFLAPFADPARPWPHEQITAVDPGGFITPYSRAAAALGTPGYLDALSHLAPPFRAAHRATLLFPAPAPAGGPR